MCGNVALISCSQVMAGYKKRGDWFTDALYVDTLRGEDSTGLCAVKFDDKKNPIILKKAIPGPEFIELKKFDLIVNSCEKYMVLMGHNRKATRGKVTAGNAHPFQHKHITLCHNGTLTSTKDLHSLADVDSEMICEEFAALGAETVLPMLEGAYALQWYDAEKHTYNIARNKERPLCFAFHEKGKYLLVASESWMIRGLASHHDLKLDMDKVFSLEPGYWLEFDPLSTDLREPKIHEFKVKEAPVSKVPFTRTRGKNTGTKGTKQRDSVSKANLKVLGLGFNEEVTIDEPTFTPYKSKNRNPNLPAIGRIDGKVWLDKSTYVNTVCFSVTEDMLDFDKDECSLVGTVIACNTVKQYYQLVVDSLEIVDWEDYTADGDGEDDTTNLYSGPNNTMITGEAYDTYTKFGCCICGGNINREDHEEVVYTHDSQPICGTCSMANLAESMSFTKQ